MQVQKPTITVIGSINMDLVTETERRPHAGETILGKRFSMTPGGKGANQAVAAARLGANVKMIGAVGDDLFGKQLLEGLKNEGIGTSGVKLVTDQETGIAVISLAEGDNSIVVVPGANYSFTADQLSEHEETIANSDVVLLQLEIPLETVIKAVEIATKHHVKMILNPAPIQTLPEGLLKDVASITPNEHEYERLRENHYDLKKKLVITKGGAGVVIFKDGEEKLIPSYPVDVVDTTGAGDAFNGALAVQIGRGQPLEESCRYANAVGALAVTKWGAQSGMPRHDDVIDFFRKMGSPNEEPS